MSETSFNQVINLLKSYLVLSVYSILMIRSQKRRHYSMI